MSVMLFFAPCLGIRRRQTLHARIVAEHGDVVLGLRQGKEARGKREEKRENIPTGVLPGFQRRGAKSAKLARGASGQGTNRKGESGSLLFPLSSFLFPLSS
jgi:hypothetical protein